MQRAHPVEYNRSIETDRRKLRWSDEEVRLLAKREAELIFTGLISPNVNQQLHLDFPSRTLESIKGRRKRSDYRSMVIAYVEEMNMAASSSAGGIGDAPAEQDPRSPELLSRTLRDLVTQLDPSKPGATEIADIALNAINGSYEHKQILDWLSSQFPRTRRPRGPKLNNPAPDIVGNSSERKRRKYAVLQAHFRKGMHVGARAVLDDTWLKGREGPADEPVFEYWGNVFRTRGTQYTPAASSENRGLRGLWDPITVEELNDAKLDTNTSAGLDGISAKGWSKIDPLIRALLYNTFLLLGDLPTELLQSRTIFVPKVLEGQILVDKLRPLSISSVVLRQFHKVLANRLRKLYHTDDRQRGFLPKDGCGDNLLILKELLSRAQGDRKELHLATIDLTKAFDTVSHEAIIGRLSEVGCPDEFTQYIRRVYSNGTSVLQIGSNERVVPVCRGVKQGDPLSPCLFNVVLDAALLGLDSEVGYELHGRRVNAMAYADDVILISTTKRGLQINLERFNSQISKLGLEINLGKSATLSLVPDGKRKKVKVLDTPWATVDGNPLPAISLLDQWKYLGVEFLGKGVKKNSADIAKRLDYIDKAPLKPQQRVAVVREYLIPRYIHGWVLGKVTSGFLRKIDDRIRASIKKWLHLPHDLTRAFFYAPLKSGGLGVPKLQETVPALLLSRLGKASLNTCPVVSHIARLQLEAAESRYRGLIRRLHPEPEHQVREPLNNGVRTPESPPPNQQALFTTVNANSHIPWQRPGRASGRYWSEHFHATTDGTDLARAADSHLSTFWVRHGRGLSGADYVRSIKLRVNALPSRTRTSRGRTTDDRCRAGCAQPETNYHVVQRCHRTHGGRVLRHDKVVETLERAFSVLGYSTLREQRFTTGAGVRKPDLVITRRDTSTVLDVQIVSGNNIFLTHKAKIEKYRSIPSFTDLVGATCNSTTTKYGAITITWRGIWCVHSVRHLQALGISMKTLRGVTTGVLKGSYLCWQRFNTLT